MGVECALRPRMIIKLTHHDDGRLGRVSRSDTGPELVRVGTRAHRDPSGPPIRKGWPKKIFRLNMAEVPSAGGWCADDVNTDPTARSVDARYAASPRSSKRCWSASLLRQSVSTL